MRALGTSDLSVFPLCLGGNIFGWTIDEAEAFAVLDAYAAAGGNFLDTADSYSAWIPGNSGGESETMDDDSTPLAETLGAFGELIREGKVRRVAASNYTAPRLAEALELARGGEQGARVSVDGFVLPKPTAADGSFTAEVDMTWRRPHPSPSSTPRRRAAAERRRSPGRARGQGRHRRRLPRLRSQRQVGRGRHRGRRPDHVRRRHRAGAGDALLLPAVRPHRRSGRQAGRGRNRHDAHHGPRLLDALGAHRCAGRYTSLFPASSSANTNTRVPFAVQVASGKESYAFPFNVYVVFDRLHSAVMNLKLGAPGVPLKDPPTPRSYKGAVYQGPLVGAVVDGRPVRPLSVTWPDRNGRFRVVLPKALAGKAVSLFLDSDPRFARRRLARGTVWTATPCRHRSRPTCRGASASSGCPRTQACPWLPRMGHRERRNRAKSLDVQIPDPGLTWNCAKTHDPARPAGSAGVDGSTGRPTAGRPP